MAVRHYQSREITFPILRQKSMLQNFYEKDSSVLTLQGCGIEVEGGSKMKESVYKSYDELPLFLN